MTTVKVWRDKVLSKVEFTDHLMSAGGMTSSQIVAAKNDANMEFMWYLMDQAGSVDPRNQATAQGLAQLWVLGYMPNAVRDVMRAWPKV